MPNFTNYLGSLTPPYPFNQQHGFGEQTPLINAFFQGQLNSVIYPVTSSIGSYIYFGAVGPMTSTLDVADYNNHTFQPFISSSGNSTGSIFVSSSIDGLNWLGDFSFVGSLTSSIIRTVSGRRRYFQATYSGSGNCTGSLYLVSGQ